MRLTDRELERLANYGIKYPWDPRDVLKLLDAIDELGKMQDAYEESMRDIFDLAW